MLVGADVPAAASPPHKSGRGSPFEARLCFPPRHQPLSHWLGRLPSRQIDDGDTIWLSNELDRVQLAARVTEGIIPGTVLAPGIWWNKLSADGRNINQLTAQHETDMGAGPAFYDVLVQIERIC